MVYKLHHGSRMKTFRDFVQRYWSLFVMLTIVIIALLLFSNPPWFQRYQAIVYAAGAFLAIFFWTVRKKNTDDREE